MRYVALLRGIHVGESIEKLLSNTVVKGGGHRRLRQHYHTECKTARRLAQPACGREQKTAAP